MMRLSGVRTGGGSRLKSINQSINPINQSINQSVRCTSKLSQSITQSLHQPQTRSVNQPIKLSRSMYQSSKNNQSDQSTNQSTNQSTDPSTEMTIQHATIKLLRQLNMTTIFGNPGSTEEPMLQNFPSDFRYVLGLQEASVVSMADGFSEITGEAVLVNLHTGPGVGNAMGAILTAGLNKSPLIITAGQQTREMVLSDPLLANREAVELPKPCVKWSYEPARAEDVPAAFMKAYIIAMSPPRGPVFLSLPLDDWMKPALGEPVVRTCSSAVKPDPDRINEFAARVARAQNPVLVIGGELDRQGGWDAGIQLAEHLQCPVFQAPAVDRVSFPQDHPQFYGILPPSIKHVSDKLKGYDLVIVIGAQVFKYYPHVPGDYLPPGAECIQFTSDARDAASAVAGDSCLGDTKMAAEDLLDAMHLHSATTTKRKCPPSPLKPRGDIPKVTETPMSAADAFATMSEFRHPNHILVSESPSNLNELIHWWPITQPGGFYMGASWGLGWAVPAAVGIAMAEKDGHQDTGLDPRPVIAFIGDGSFQYSIQGIYTAIQRKLKIIYVIPVNKEYLILKQFALLEHSPGVPGLDLPGLDIQAQVKGFGGQGVHATTQQEIRDAFKQAEHAIGPFFISVPIKSDLHPLLS